MKCLVKMKTQKEGAACAAGKGVSPTSRIFWFLQLTLRREGTYFRQHAGQQTKGRGARTHKQRAHNIYSRFTADAKWNFVQRHYKTPEKKETNKQPGERERKPGWRTSDLLACWMQKTLLIFPSTLAHNSWLRTASGVLCVWASNKFVLFHEHRLKLDSMLYMHVIPKKIVSASRHIYFARCKIALFLISARLKRQKVEREWRRPRAPSRPEHAQEMTLICAERNTRAQSSQKTPAERRRSERTRHIYTQGFALVCPWALRGIWTKPRAKVFALAYVHIKELAPHQILRDLARDLCGWPRRSWAKMQRVPSATITLRDAELILKGLPAQTKQTTR